MKDVWSSLRALTSGSHGILALLMVGGMAAAGVAHLVAPASPASRLILLGVLLIAALPLCIELIREIARGNFSVDVLAFLSIATSIALREYWVAAIVILMLSGGKSLEEYATRRASSVLGALARRMPQVAHRLSPDGAISDIPAASVGVGDRLAIYPHELCPVDGVVVGGSGSMDESYLTGEPFLISKIAGATVLSGAINGDSILTIEATRVAGDSRYARIVEVLHASEQNRPRIRRLGDRLGSWYTPLAVALALLSWLISGQPERFLAVLVIATPCPLLLAIPVAVIGAISVCARHGIIVKDPSILEKVDRCRTLIVDKTGTLTYGRPTLTDILPYGSWPAETLLSLAATLERFSRHPLASAVLRAAEEKAVALMDAEDVSESPGSGLSGHVGGHRLVLTGRSKLAPEVKAQLPAVLSGLECIVLIDGQLAGQMRFHDEPRVESRSFLSHLTSRHGFSKTILLSGDRPAEVTRFADQVGISEVYGGKSPEEKLEIVRRITAETPTLYLGDGINDAPAMMNASVGIALGVSSEITSEAAGAVILQSSLSSVDDLMHVGRRMRRIALTSALGGMLLSGVGMAAAALGLLRPIQGAILQEVIDLAAILNSLRMILPAASPGDFSDTSTSTVHMEPPVAAPKTSHV